jgi:hypothetical protein
MNVIQQAGILKKEEEKECRRATERRLTRAKKWPPRV